MPKILIVEDDPDMSLLLSRMVSSLGYETCAAHNGFEGERLALHGQPDLVLMDFMMPVQDGCVTSRNLRRKGYNKPIIMISALTSFDDSCACGADAFLRKPINIEALRECLNQYLQINARIAENPA